MLRLIKLFISWRSARGAVNNSSLLMKGRVLALCALIGGPETGLMGGPIRGPIGIPKGSPIEGPKRDRVGAHLYEAPYLTGGVYV